MKNFFRRAHNFKSHFYRNAEDTAKAGKDYYWYSHPYHHYYHHHCRRGGWFGKTLFLGLFAGAVYYGVQHYNEKHHHHNHFGPHHEGNEWRHGHRGETLGDRSPKESRKLNKAIEKFKVELDKIIATKGEDSKEAAMLYFIIGTSLSGMEAFAEGRRYLEKALDIGSKAGDDSSYFVKTVGETLNLMKQNEEKMKSTKTFGSSGNDPLEGSIEMMKSVHGNISKEVAQFYNTVGQTYLKSNDYNKAVNSFGEALRQFNQIEGENSADGIFAARNLAFVYKKMGEQEKSRKLLEETFQRSKRVYGENHPETIRIYSEMQSL